MGGDPFGAGGDSWKRLAKLADLGVMTASLLHELRQPLFAIKAEAQLGRVAEPSARFDRILTQVEAMEGLIASHVSAGEPDEAVAVFDLNDAVRSAVEMLSHRKRSSAATLDLDLTVERLPVRGRRAAARQVAVNLLQNAFDAVEEVDRRRVVVRTRAAEQLVLLEVEDSGPGLPEHLIPRIFDPFVTSKPPGRGTGLGLFIARHLVREAHGELRLTAGALGGARAMVDFPRAAVAPEGAG